MTGLFLVPLQTVINKSAYHHAEDAVNTHKTWKTQYSSGQEAAGTVSEKMRGSFAMLC